MTQIAKRLLLSTALAALFAAAPAGFAPLTFAGPTAALAKGGDDGRDDSGRDRDRDDRDGDDRDDDGDRDDDDGDDDRDDDDGDDDRDDDDGDDDDRDEDRDEDDDRAEDGDDDPNGIEVALPGGGRIEIENGRFEMKDASGRTVVERPATPADYAAANASATPAPSGDVAKAEVRGSSIEVTWRDGWKEEIEAGRYELKDPAGRTVTERPATEIDRIRLEDAAGV